MSNRLKNKFLCFLSALFVVAVQANAPQTAITPGANSYTLDPNHSYVSWRVNHFGFSNPSGKWMANGVLVFDQKQPTNSHVNVNIKVDSLITGLPELDKHLKTPLFFDVEKFPTATFVSNKIAVTGKNKGTVAGVLTLHGVSKPITLKVVLNKVGVNPINNLNSVGFSATTSLKRSDFGINGYLPNISDDVNLQIEVEANQPKSA
jgi:polyisoprenoid-binding protein YceI